MSSFLQGSAFTELLDNDSEYRLVPNLIREYISDRQLKALCYHCLRVDILDNNDKAEIVKMILGPDFEEIGTGTNRIALFHNGFVIKVALDRRGLVDNFQEFKRSIELPNFLARTYETNYLINIAEYVEVMDQDKFIINEYSIKQMLKEISKGYLFDDIGFTLKNSYNWGCRESKFDDEDEIRSKHDYEICILDYGYLYPLHGQKDKLLRCPLCEHRLKWNSSYTGLGCENSMCKFQTSPMQLRKKMKLDYEELENKLTSSLNNLKMPNLTSIEKEIRKIDKGRKEDQ